MSPVLTAIDHLPMAEACGQVLTVYVDAVGRVEIMEPGVNVRVTYVEVRNIGNQRYRVPVLEVVRPLVSFVHGHMAMLLAQAKREANALDPTFKTAVVRWERVTGQWHARCVGHWGPGS